MVKIGSAGHSEASEEEDATLWMDWTDGHVRIFL